MGSLEQNWNTGPPKGSGTRAVPSQGRRDSAGLKTSGVTTYMQGKVCTRDGVGDRILRGLTGRASRESRLRGRARERLVQGLGRSSPRGAWTTRASATVRISNEPNRYSVKAKNTGRRSKKKYEYAHPAGPGLMQAADWSA